MRLNNNLYDSQDLGAKDAYQKSHKKAFDFEHCWRELREHPKWASHMQEKKDKEEKRKGKGKVSAKARADATSVSASVSASDEPVASSSTSRPRGTKGSKEHESLKRKFEDLHEQMRQTDKEFMEETRKRNALLQKLADASEQARDHAIMAQSLEGMDEVQIAYYQDLRREILAKRVRQREEDKQ